MAQINLTIFELREQHKRQHEELKLGLELQIESLKDEILNTLEDHLEKMSMSIIILLRSNEPASLVFEQNSSLKRNGKG